MAAYDDAAGVTAAFNRNVLHVINRELDADFDAGRLRARRAVRRGAHWIEMRLRATRDMHVRVGDLGLHVSFEAGEEVRTEISAKFRPDDLRRELVSAGFEVNHRYIDPTGDFSLFLASA